MGLLMKSIFMRVLFCKIHFSSFICFCKSSAAQLYNPGQLKLENTPHVPATVVSVSDTSEFLPIEGKDEIFDGKEKALKSCIKKVDSELKEVEKKRVQWMDHLGEQLVETREFESSDTEDSDTEEDYRGCCSIL